MARQRDRLGEHGVAIEKGNHPASCEVAPGDEADPRPRSPVMPAHRESPIDPDRLLPVLINNLRLFLDCLR
jgi:hypothetical protein